MKKRVGVFVCDCGANIAATVDTVKVTEAAQKMPGVVYAVNYKYMCSDPGQDMIKNAIKEFKLDQVVVASCSPRMHEKVFRHAVEEGGINGYMFEQINLREQVSWVHHDMEEATEKAIELVRAGVAKVVRNQPLYSSTIPVTRKALVIGGGIAGMQAALDIADNKYPVVLVEKDLSIGGKMAQLDKTFPTMDCSACICSPKMVAVAQHPNIEIVTYAEVVKVSGYVGNFTVTIHKKPKYVDWSLCTGCGTCIEKCPTKKVANEFDLGMSNRTAIYKEFPQAVPSKPRIDAEHCLKLTKDKCGVCEKICPTKSIRFNEKDEYIDLEVGAIVMATGYDLFKWEEVYGEYGYGKYPDVITSLHFERLVNAGGPTGGHIQRPSDGKEPKKIAFIKCIGSRDDTKGRSYCSRACCMYTAKHAYQFKTKVEDSEAFVFYMDVRTAGKNYEEFYQRSLQAGAKYIRGRVSKIYQRGDKLILKTEDTLIGRPLEVEVDMVVLATAMVPTATAEELARTVGFSTDKDGWYQEAHPKLQPVETFTAGVFLAGTCQGPKDIPDSVAQASATAAKVGALLSNDELSTEPMISEVDPSRCSGCGLCLSICPFKALSLKDYTSPGQKRTRSVVEVNGALCQGCGACVPACRTMALNLKGFTDEQIAAEVDAICL